MQSVQTITAAVIGLVGAATLVVGRYQRAHYAFGRGLISVQAKYLVGLLLIFLSFLTFVSQFR